MGRVKWFSSLRVKLFLSFILVSILPLSFITVAISSLIETDYITNRKDELRRRAGYMADSIKRGGYLTDSSKESYFITEMTQSTGDEAFRVLVLDSRGIVVYDKNDTETGVTFYAPEIIRA
ncbi:MAG: cell wall metabolism sensor histidine kinase WalK, partial [Clostridiales bacterium]|nr:cell wall metabolism sensor histidine kinase WalK [Clostridiales bacterium]